MNLQHLKYILEVEKTKSINKAAENLYMGQPNLSRAIKDFEESLGITIFTRTPKGMETTEQGEEFLKYARSILAQVEKVEALYAPQNNDALKFAIALPRASYLSEAFINFINKIDKTKDIEFNYKESNTMRVLKCVGQEDFNLGIIRSQTAYISYYESIAKEKNLIMRDIFEFNYVLLMSKDCGLAKLDNISHDDLCQYIEVLHGDPYIPTMSAREAKKAEFSGTTNKRIFIYERGTQFEMLSNIPETYMWVSPVPQSLLDRHNLIQLNCKEYSKKYKDILIFRKDYHLSSLDNLFLEEVVKSKRSVMQ